MPSSNRDASSIEKGSGTKISRRGTVAEYSFVVFVGSDGEFKTRFLETVERELLLLGQPAFVIDLARFRSLLCGTGTMAEASARRDTVCRLAPLMPLASMVMLMDVPEETDGYSLLNTAVPVDEILHVSMCDRRVREQSIEAGRATTATQPPSKTAMAPSAGSRIVIEIPRLDEHAAAHKVLSALMPGG